MIYSDFIKTNEGFQYSINIQYDLMKKNKIENYIPTKNSISILKEYLESIFIKDSDKATVLVGPYGKGKSHLLLVLLAIMYGNKEDKYIKKLIKKIEKVDSECAELANDVLINKKYLPVVINFNSNNLSQALLVALNNALTNTNLVDILPETYFDSALKVIKGWEGYPDTIKKFKKSLKDIFNIKYAEMIRELKSFNNEYYEIFKKVFEEITSGVEFNPLTNTDVVKLYEEVNYKIKETYNYDGIIIIFDEFSKFIEASENNNAKDLKILQDLAELSSRSKSPQMYLICITHKSVSEYISNIPTDKVDAWRAIEGRFKEKYFTTSAQQEYELISNAINKDEKKFKEYIKGKKEQIENLSQPAIDLFSMDYEEYTKDIVYGCFPLSPYTTYCLPIVSEKVAQNERTLFTYLSKDEPNSLMNFVNDNSGKLELINLSSLYDYFEQLFKKETFNEKIYNIYLKVDAALKNIDLKQDAELIKSLGVIYIINDFNMIPPSVKVLSNILNVDSDYLEKIIERLIKNNVLIKKKSTGYLDFMPYSNIDIINIINNLSKTKYSEPKYNDTIQEVLGTQFILPKKYNDKYRMTRFFKRIFMTTYELEAYSNSKMLLDEYKCDGIIIDLIYFNKSEVDNIKKFLIELDDSRILVVIPDQKTMFENQLSEYEAIKDLEKDEELIKEDPRVKVQLELLREDLEENINKIINFNYNIANDNCKLIVKNKEHNKLKNNQVTDLLSMICEEYYGKTPIINNELINKKEISSQVKKARNIIVDMLLDGSYKEFDYSKNALECTLFRATLINNNILLDKDKMDDNTKLLISTMKDFVKSAENDRKSFKELYNILEDSKYNISIRRGVIPIFLSYIIKDYKDEVIIYVRSGRNRKEVILNSIVIENINEKPENYELNIEVGTEEKRKYIEFLSELFLKYNTMSTGNKYVDIVKGMQGWLQSLSLFTKNSRYKIDNKKEYYNFDEVSESTIKLRNALVKYEINSREFLFDKIMKIMKSTNCEECKNMIKLIKKELDSNDKKLKDYLIDHTKKLFGLNYEGSLVGQLRAWYISLEDNIKQHVFNSNTNDFLNCISDLSSGDYEAINKLGLIMTNLSIEDWNDNTITLYFNEFKNVLNEIDNYKEDSKIGQHSEIKIILNSSDNQVIEKTFNKTVVSSNGSLLMNEIENSFEEFGDSIDDNEKRSILINLLQKFM